MEVHMLEQDKLRRCAQCGELKGEALVDDRWEGLIYLPVRCLCEGIVCCYCRAGAIHRPISNRFDEATGRVLHIAYFGWMAPCRDCSRRLRAEQGDPIGIRLPAPGSMLSSAP
jgi:hypothetical protein